jgi:hypothetical protein
MNLMSLTNLIAPTKPAGDEDEGLTNVVAPSEENEEKDLPKTSPNRVEDTDTRSVIESIANTIGRFENMSVTFDNTKFTLITNFNAPHSMLWSVVANNKIPSELDDVIKIIKKNLSKAGHSSVKIKRLDVDITPGMYTYRNKNVNYDVKAQYEIEP